MKASALAKWQPGDRIEHAIRRTVSQTDNSWFTLLTLNTAPHFDVTSPSFQGFESPLMNSCSTLGMVQGIAQHELGRCVQPGETILSAHMPAPVYAGETLRAETEVLARLDRADGGVDLKVRMTGHTDKRDRVIEIERWWRDWSEEAWHEYDAGSRICPDIETANVPAPYGPHLDDFKAGDVFDHPLRRSLFGDEGAWFSLLHMSRAPYVIDAHFLSDGKGPLIEDSFVVALIVGISVVNTTQNANANLGWENVRFYRPVRSGDTLSARTRVIQSRASKSRPGQGIVTVDTWGLNQNHEPVVSFRRNFLTRTRAAFEALRKPPQ